MSDDRKSGSPATEPFNKLLDECSKKTKSKIILALDIPHRKKTGNLLSDSLKLVEFVSDFVCCVKINFHLIIPLSLHEISALNDSVHSDGLVSIS